MPVTPASASAPQTSVLIEQTSRAGPSGPAHDAKGLALENLLGLRERRQSRLRLRERACAHVDRRGLRRDRDLLARGGVATLPRLGGRLEAHRQLNEIADLHLLRIADLAEDDFLERG